MQSSLSIVFFVENRSEQEMESYTAKEMGNRANRAAKNLTTDFEFYHNTWFNTNCKWHYVSDQKWPSG